MGIAIYPKDVNAIKTNITENVGQKVIIKGSSGRSKTFEETATIQKVYPNIFEVKCDSNDRNITFQYKDVLTKNVEVSVFNGTEYSPLIPKIEL
jgi:uncharacterized protein Veg